MWRHQVVLYHDHGVDAHVAFTNNSTSERQQVLYLPHALFKGLGEPNSITVTVETGDRLNG